MPQDENLIKQQIRLVSHEIRNQLSVSDIYCEIIRKQLTKNNIENEAIERALNCIQKSAKLIGNSLIDLKSVTNVQVQHEFINPLIEECVDLGKTYIYDKDINIISELAENVEVLTDKNKLQACIINLIKNAAEAIDSKGTIKIRTQLKTDKLEIFVSNNGKPISPKERSQIFNDGFTTKQTGSGIGLYLSRKNLRTQGGELELTQSKNTEFKVTFKVNKAIGQ